MDTLRMKRILTPLSFPIITYSFFFITKALGVEPEVDDIGGLHAFYGIIYLLAGFFVSYFMMIIGNYKKIRKFWGLSALLFIVMSTDGAIGIHEYFGWTLKDTMGHIAEMAPYPIYALLLGTITFVWRKSLGMWFWILLIGFGVLSLIAIFGDIFSTGGNTMGEGIFIFKGIAFSYEQFCETAAFLCLCGAFVSEALNECLKPTKQDSN